MNSSLSTYAITPVELKGVRCKISKKKPEGKIRRRSSSSLFSWRKCSDTSTVNGDDDDDEEEEEELLPSIRAVVWCQQNKSPNCGVADSVLSCPMEVVSEDEDGGMIMNCVWPNGALLYVPDGFLDTNKGGMTLGLGIQVQNDALLEIGTASVSLIDCGSAFLAFLPVKQSEEQVDNGRYLFDVSSSRLATVLDMIDETLNLADSYQPFLSSSKKAKESNVTLYPSSHVSEYGTTTSEYVEDDWKPWETDDVEINVFERADDFSFEPVVYEDVDAEHAELKKSVEPVESVEQGEQADQVEAAKTLQIATTAKTVKDDARRDDPLSLTVIKEEKNGDNGDTRPVRVDRQDKTMIEDCFDDMFGPNCLYGKRMQSNANEEVVDYPSSLIEFKDETGEINHIEFTDDNAGHEPKTPVASDVSPEDPAKMSPDIIIKDLEGLLRRWPKDFLKRRNKTTRGKSTVTVATASTCSSSSDKTLEEDFAPGCGCSLAGLVDIIKNRNCIEKNFELCLEEFFDAAADDDNSFASESYYSVSVCTDVIKNKRATSVRRNDDESKVEEIEMLPHVPKKKKGFIRNLKRM